MSIGRTNAGGGGTGGTLTVTAPAGVTVTVSKDGKTKTRTVNSSGIVVFKGLTSGTWTVTITGDGKTAQKTVAITTDYSTAISFNAIPEFTYTGDFEIVSDDDQPITVSQDNFKIRLLTSGTLIFTSLNGAEGGIDVFLVGGGGAGGGGGANSDSGGYVQGAGGGGGYTKTIRDVSVAVGVEYSIAVGAGGTGGTAYRTKGADGGATSAFSQTAPGGKGGGENCVGGDGGSGGGAACYGGNDRGSAGGVDGADGEYEANTRKGGTGQGTTTREFGETSGKLYSSGGDGYKAPPTAKSANSGDGGYGNGYGANKDGAGGSGIVIIRNTREAS